MAATATMSSSGPRYAPEDPTLPKPWRGLVDGKTGYLYFWNPETNVTQYERPTGASSSAHISSSVQVRQPSPGQQRGYNPDKEDDRYGRGNNGGSRGIQSAVGGAVGSQNAPKGTVGFGHGAPSVKEQGHLSTGSSLSADAYQRLHEITVSGPDVPPALTSFEATGFPPEILREVRYLLLGGANVVRNAVLFWGLALIWGTFRRWTNYLEGLSKSLMFVAGTADGDNSVCYLVQTEEVVSSCSSLHQQALVAACRG